MRSRCNHFGCKLLTNFLYYRVAGDVISGCILKCFNARPKTKEKGIEIVMMYVEVEKQDIVQVCVHEINTMEISRVVNESC